MSVVAFVSAVVFLPLHSCSSWFMLCMRQHPIQAQFFHIFDLFSLSCRLQCGVFTMWICVFVDRFHRSLCLIQLLLFRSHFIISYKFFSYFPPACEYTIWHREHIFVERSSTCWCFSCRNTALFFLFLIFFFLLNFCQSLYEAICFSRAQSTLRHIFLLRLHRKLFV